MCMKVFDGDGQAVLGGSSPWRAMVTPVCHLENTVTHKAWWYLQFQCVHCDHPGIIHFKIITFRGGGKMTEE